MGLIRTTQNKYYNEEENHGNYQFTKLNDIIDSFLVVYVGEDKVIPRATRTDVRFHAMRAMQELSFDTFKSTKAQEIVLPPSLQMILPHDYVSYTKVSWVDGSGIKHPIYPITKTSNPMSILQDDNGEYEFSADKDLVVDPSFAKQTGVLHPKWGRTKLQGLLKKSSLDTKPNSNPTPGTIKAAGRSFYYTGGTNITLGKDGGGTVGALNFSHAAMPIGVQGSVIYTGHVLAVWHRVNVRGMVTIDVGATVRTALAAGDHSNGNVVVAIVKEAGDQSYNDAPRGQGKFKRASKNTKIKENAIEGKYLEWGAAEAGSSISKEMVVNVDDLNIVYILMTSTVQFTGDDGFSIMTNNNNITNSFTGAQYGDLTKSRSQGIRNFIQEVTVTNGLSPDNLQHKNVETGDSETFKKYQEANSIVQNETFDERFDYNGNEIDRGQRYGSKPSDLNINGSFYIDDRNGKINFSSNISGRTVILDYLSDSLGTDEEMQVHKFAEDALYKSIICDVVSGRAGVPEYAIKRYKQDKKAARRNAKLRLSNIKLEEITQIFRNKSKIIKH